VDLSDSESEDGVECVTPAAEASESGPASPDCPATAERSTAPRPWTADDMAMAFFQALWTLPVGAEPLAASLVVRDAALVRELSTEVERLLVVSGDMLLSFEQKQVLDCLLRAQVYRAANPDCRSRLREAAQKALLRLECQLNQRQAQLHTVREYTDQVDVRFPHLASDGSMTSEIHQRDALPEEYWSALEQGPRGSTLRMRAAGLLAVLRTFRRFCQTSTPQFSTFLDDLREQGLFASEAAFWRHSGAALLHAYGTRVDSAFVEFMTTHFGTQFHAGPVKKVRRMRRKLEEDHPYLTCRDPLTDAGVREAYGALGDVVRGTVKCDGGQEMLRVLNHLRGLHPTFEVWRIKNTHHPMAQVVGGYRDVKVLGRFDAGEVDGLRLCMVVEVQVIDEEFARVKAHMHKAYALDRGDFDVHCTG